MASATISRKITPEQAVGALREQLGGSYKVTQRGRDSLTVRHGSLAFATVHVGRNGTATTFRVHGGGLIVGRIVNELGIARTVTAAIRESLGSEPPAGSGG
jgi:hypothetical protein